MSEQDDFRTLEAVSMKAHARSEVAKLRLLKKIASYLFLTQVGLASIVTILFCIFCELHRRR